MGMAAGVPTLLGHDYMYNEDEERRWVELKVVKEQFEVTSDDADGRSTSQS